MTAIAGAPRRIELDDVTALGNVDDALGDFYVEQIAAAAATSGVPPRVIREWFEDQLISAQGFRTQVLDGPGDSGPVVLRELEDAHLIRADSRRGAQWYEISHDRLVAPILASNAAWRDRHLSALQVDARAWDRADRPAGLLIGGEVLATAEAWASANPDELLPVDRDYLDACRAAEVQIIAIQRAARRNRVLAIAASALLVLAVIGLLVAMIYWRSASESADEARIARDDAEQALQAAEDAEAAALREAQRAEDEAQRAEEEAERASAEENEAREAQDAALLAEDEARQAEAVAATEAANSSRSAAAANASERRAQQDRDAALRAEREASTARDAALQAEDAALDAESEASKARRTADSERLGLIASGSAADPGLAGLLAVEAQQSASTPISRRALLDAARALGAEQRCTVFPADVVAVARDGAVAGYGDGEVSMWHPGQHSCTAILPYPRWTRTVNESVSVALSPDGSLLAVWGGATAVLETEVFDGASGDVRAVIPDDGPVSFSADGRWLATPRGVYDMHAPNPAASGQPNLFGELVRFSGDGRIVAGTIDEKLHIDAFPDGGQRRHIANPIAGESSWVSAFDLSSSGLLAFAFETTIYVEEPTTGQGICVLDGHIGRVTSLVFSPDGSTLLSSSQDGTVRTWTLGGDAGQPPCSMTGTIFGVLGTPQTVVDGTSFGGTAIVARIPLVTRMSWTPALFGASPDELVAIIRERLDGRTLTDEERARYRIEAIAGDG